MFDENVELTLLPATVFCDVYRQRGVKILPRHISSSRAHSEKIPTATPTFSGSRFLVVVLPMSWDIDVYHKSKMAAKLPEVLISPKLIL